MSAPERGSVNQAYINSCCVHPLHLYTRHIFNVEDIVCCYKLISINVPVSRLFSGGGPEETTWSELRHELLGPGERAAGWRPELQLASRMRASFQVIIIIIIIIITVHHYQTLSVCVSFSFQTDSVPIHCTILFDIPFEISFRKMTTPQIAFFHTFNVLMLKLNRVKHKTFHVPIYCNVGRRGWW